MKLQAKILFILTPLAVIPLLLVGWLTYSEITTNTKQRTLETLEVLSEETSTYLKSRIEETEGVARILTNSKLLSKFIQTSNVYEKFNVLIPGLEEVFSHYLQVYPEIITIRIRDAAGADLLSVPEKADVLLKHEKTGTTLLNIDRTSFIYPADDRPLFIHTIKLYSKSYTSNREKSLFGYLDIFSSMSVIDSVIEKSFKEKYGVIFFADKNGNIMRNEFDLKLLASNELPKIQHLIQESKVSPQEIEFRGHTSFIQGHKIDQNLFMFSLLTHQQIKSSSDSYFYRMSGIVGISIFLFSVLGFLSIKYLLIRPLQQLGAAAQDIGEGNLEFSLDIKNKDELGDLSTSLKEMSHNLRQSNEQIRYMAYHDSLTKLPNRRMFSEYLSHALAHARRRNQALALMYLDLDDFKVINDTLGHQAGDAVLRELSNRLSDCIRDEDYLGRPTKSRRSETETVARLGGDEFIIFLPDINSPYEAANVANRVLEALSIPFHVENRDLHVSASIGITTYPKDGNDVETLIKNADMAMYHAKEKGKNAYSYYQESMNVAAFELLNLQSEMRQALAKNEFILHYQPQVDLNTGEIISVEALIRWQHPEKGLISPDAFIPVAEQSELIVAIGEWVIREACQQVKVWHDEGHVDLCVSVNASAAQLHRHDLKEVIQEALLSNNLPAKALEIELTETAIGNSEETVFETLTAIKSLGVQIAMDDFGTGYSSLGYLSKLPIDKIKVDRSFVQDITSETTHAPIISAILAMAHSLELPVTAEGVELQAQIDFLRVKGCGLIQGFLISHPVSANDISQLLEQKNLLKKTSSQPI